MPGTWTLTFLHETDFSWSFQSRVDFMITRKWDHRVLFRNEFDKCFVYYVVNEYDGVMKLRMVTLLYFLC